MLWLIPITLILLVEVSLDIISKENSITDHWHLWLAAILGYAITNVIWLWSIKRGSGIARAMLILSVIFGVGAVLIGVFF